MIALEQLTSLKEYLHTAQTAAVILGPKPTPDQAAVASALYQGLVKMGKNAGLYAPKALGEHTFSALPDVKTELGKQNLVVELDYNEDAVDKVSYHIGEKSKKFYLTIKPRRGAKPLDTKNVQFSYAGAEADLVFLVGVHDLEVLEQLYFGYENLYESAFVVTLHTFEPELGSVRLDLSGASSMSEAAAGILEGLEIPLTAEMSTDLLGGIESMTNGLQSLTATAETFEVVAKLLHAGARRGLRPKQNAVVKPVQSKPTRSKTAEKSKGSKKTRPTKQKRRKLIIKR